MSTMKSVHSAYTYCIIKLLYLASNLLKLGCGSLKMLRDHVSYSHISASIVTESIFENRFKYADELSRMGACIKVEGNSAIIDGVEKLTGARVSAPDLRAGAALVIAGLAA